VNVQFLFEKKKIDLVNSIDTEIVAVNFEMDGIRSIEVD